ncbi:MAG TPA: hypothetical protein EYP06_01195 [Desulfobacterales bacterium]|nr:hypothetical protein [Desulfobacterales bacterium]
MKKSFLPILLLLLAIGLSLGAYIGVKKVLALPFRATNDMLHQESWPINLDFLIPAGIHIPERMSIGEVIKIRFKGHKAIWEQWAEAIMATVPIRYRYLANIVFYGFWFFLFMVFFRLFTFMGYGRAFRISLLLGGITYFFMPDFRPGRLDDLCAVLIPLAIIMIKWKFFGNKKRIKARV